MKMDAEKLYFAAVKSDPKMFLLQAFKEVHPGKTFIDGFHIEAMLHALTESFAGRIPRLIINVPPRHLKSFICSVVWPAYVLGHDPSAKLMYVSYSDVLAKQLSWDFRTLVESAWYKKIFNKTIFNKSTESESKTTAGGARYARSVNGTITGIGADVIVMDDPMDPQQVLSDKARHQAIEFYQAVLSSRLDSKAKGVIILVQQRLHQGDMSAYLSNSGFKKLSLPAIAQRDEKIAIGNGLFHERFEGDLLCEKLEDKKTLDKIRQEMGQYVFAAQWLQNPQAPDGVFFKSKHLHYTDKMPFINNLTGEVWISIDAASSTSETADYTSITTGFSEYHTGLHYILLSERGRYDYEALMKVSLKYAEKYDRPTFVIENAAAGISLIQSLRKLGHHVVAHSAKGSKQARAHLVLPIFEDNRVRVMKVPKHDAWIESFESELLTFPFARYDDQVDSFVQGLRYGDRRVPQASNVYC